MYDLIAVGGGVGGLSLAALRSRWENVLLLEREPTLGGCAGTFRHKGLGYPAGATTVSGYDPGQPLHRLFEALEIAPEIQTLDPAITVYHGGRTLPRFREFDRFLEAVDRAYPHPGNRAFWGEIRRLCHVFWREWPGISYPGGLSGLWSFRKLIARTGLSALADGAKTVEKMLPGLSGEYRAFLDSQLVIAVQARLDRVTFLAAALALGYTFSSVGRVPGGMGRLAEAIGAKIGEVRTGEKVETIRREGNRWRVVTNRREELATRVVLGTSLFHSGELFSPGSRERAWLEKQGRRFESVGAFLVYGKLAPPPDLPRFFQAVDGKRALFFSREGETFSLSTHTDPAEWNRMDGDAYREKKEKLREALLKRVFAIRPELETAVTHTFAATPETYRRFLGRAGVGGIPVLRKYLPSYPPPTTPFPGLFRVGDTVFPGQGWPGAVMGAFNAHALLS